MITVFPVMSFPAYDLAAIDVFDHVQVIMLPDNMTWAIRNPKAVSEYLVTQFAGLEHEVFACLFLDNRHRLGAKRWLGVQTRLKVDRRHILETTVSLR